MRFDDETRRSRRVARYRRKWDAARGSGCGELHLVRLSVISLAELYTDQEE